MIEQYFNPAQQEVNLISARDNVVVGGRGIGKSILHATFNLRNMQRMPGSNGGFVSANTKRCLTNTIPSMLQHWERWGFHRSKHYVIGIKPPKKLGWPDPVIPPSNWENTISFYNGSIGTIISQDRKGTSNSLSLDYLDIDEAKFIDFEQLKDETFPANRGNVNLFGQHYYHHGMLITSDMPVTKKGSWFLNYKKDCDPHLIEAISSLVVEEYDIRNRIKTSGHISLYAKRRLKEIGLLLAQLRSKALFYKEYSSVYNVEVLGMEFIKQMKRDLPALTFQTSIMCKRPSISLDGFYSNLRDVNLYSAPNLDYLDGLEYDVEKLQHVDSRMDADVDPDRPLCIAFDANALINWIAIGQDNLRGEARLLKSIFVKYEEKLPTLLDKFMAYYAYHRCKEVNFYYDSTFVGNNYALMNDDFHTFITNYLTDHGWYVNEVYLGNPMGHIEKMLLINRMFLGKADHRAMINDENNEDMLLSIRLAGVYNGKKDKRGEKLAETEEDKLEARTDGSDAFDSLMIGIEKFPQADGYVSCGSML